MNRVLQFSGLLNKMFPLRMWLNSTNSIYTSETSDHNAGPPPDHHDRIYVCYSDLGRLITAASSCCCWGGCACNKPQSAGGEPAGTGDGQQSEKYCVTSRKQLTTRPAFRPTVASNLVLLLGPEEQRHIRMWPENTRELNDNFNLKFYIMRTRREHTHTHTHTVANFDFYHSL